MGRIKRPFLTKTNVPNLLLLSDKTNCFRSGLYSIQACALEIDISYDILTSISFLLPNRILFLCAKLMK
jgi:hypothetical protein